MQSIFFRILTHKDASQENLENNIETTRDPIIGHIYISFFLFSNWNF